MGNKTSTIKPNNDNDLTSIDIVRDCQKDIYIAVNNFQNSLMEQFTDKDRGTVKKFDTIALYSDIREITFIEVPDKKYEISLLVNEYEKKYKLNDKQNQMLLQLYKSIDSLNKVLSVNGVKKLFN